MSHTPFTDRVIAVVRAIPPGSVMTYGQVAAAAGDARAARQVVRVLCSLSASEHLPWHRVVNARGGISLPPGRGLELQRALLEEEGIAVDAHARLDLKRYRYLPPDLP